MPQLTESAVIEPTKVGNDRLASPAELEVIRFGDYLVERKVIDRQQLFVAIDFHLRKRCRLGEAVVYFGYVEQEEMDLVAAEYHGLVAVEV